jgi:4-hydroxy-tetrahydrodipicolinate reductase
MSTPRLLINGAKGRMGQALLAAARDAGLTVAAALDQGDDLAAVLPSADVIVDFSHHSATAGVIELALQHRKPLVIGTTGHTPAARAALGARLATGTAGVWAGNYSVGVNLLFHLTEEAARVLGDDYDIEVTEMHHRFKQDAPSGTAARLLEILQRSRGLGEEALRHGRQGLPGARTKREIGIHSLRGGDVVGDHTVLFAALGERLELTHKASDRGIFARGALHAARWVATQAPGLYDMQDVLGFRRARSP